MRNYRKTASRAERQELRLVLLCFGAAAILAVSLLRHLFAGR